MLCYVFYDWVGNRLNAVSCLRAVKAIVLMIGEGTDSMLCVRLSLLNALC
jgi:hypothetical protein